MKKGQNILNYSFNYDFEPTQKYWTHFYRIL